MDHQDEPGNAPGETEGEKRRDWPRLTLKGSSAFDPTYDEISEEHDLYPLAAWGYHHAHGLDPAARQGFFDALARAWPCKGRRKTRYRRGVVFAVLLARGISPDQIAARWHLTPGEVTDNARDATGAVGTPSKARIVTEHESFDDDAPSDRMPRPYDSATQAGRLWSRKPGERGEDENWRLAGELARELGYDDLAGLLGTPDDSERRQEGTIPLAVMREGDLERHRKGHRTRPRPSAGA